MNSICWQPSSALIANSNMKKFQDYLENEYSLSFQNYHELWLWSIENTAVFWKSIYQFFTVNFHHPYQQIISETDKMYETKWFTGATLNYAEYLFSNKTTAYPALIYQQEDKAAITISWKELEEKVSAFQQFLDEKNIQKGDRVVAYLPNCPEAVIAFLACNSKGIIWSCCSPDFGTESIIERFQQIEPKLFIAKQHYQYHGKQFDRLEVIKEIGSQIQHLEEIVLIADSSFDGYHSWSEIMQNPSKTLHFEKVDFDHPIWILFSSGTTGKPKAIVHRTGGMLLEHLKALALHQDCKKGERYLWYSTTGWMMWNYALSSLLAGCTLCIYDGAANYPDLNILWKIVSEQKINHFGAGAAFYLTCKKQNLNIAGKFNLSSLRTLGSTGSPLPADGFDYIYQSIKKEVWLISLSGGTDVCSAFVGGNPLLPVYRGEIQCRMLGAAIQAWNDKNENVVEELGELMLCKAMPCMPVYFWNDEDKNKYKNAYFEENNQIWRHGDWIKITSNDGVIIYGRSDATLNRNGVRIGTAEIYNVIENMEEIKDSLIICLEKNDGSFYMPLFVVLKKNCQLNEELKNKINTNLRKQYSPRHVPDEIIAVTAIPYTLSGKKMEMPVKKIMLGKPVAQSISLDAMRNPECVEEYIKIAKNKNTKF